MITVAWLTLIYATAVFFWLRFFYIRSLKTAAGRSSLFESLKEISLFVPITIQAIFLFCLAVIQVIPLCFKLSAFIEFIFVRNVQTVAPDFNSLKIIFIGSLLLTIQYGLLKKTFSYNKVLDIVVKLSVFMISIFFLKILFSNIYHLLFFLPPGSLFISYNNNFLSLLCFILVVVFAFMKEEWMYDGQINTVKYLSLASRILLGYLLLVLILTLPAIICLVIQHI